MEEGLSQSLRSMWWTAGLNNNEMWKHLLLTNVLYKGGWGFGGRWVGRDGRQLHKGVMADNVPAANKDREAGEVACI